MNKVVAVAGLTVLLGMFGCSRQQSDWEKTRSANTPDAYEIFLKKYPSGEFAGQAQARLKELNEERDWQKARDTDTLEAYQAFLKEYPEGKWTDEARIRVENFTLAQAPNGTPSSPPSDAAAEPAPAAAPVTAAPPAAAAPVSKSESGAYSVQLGAFKSGAGAADKHWADLQRQYPKAFSAVSHKVSPIQVPSGTLYRLQVLHLSEAHASEICTTMKAHAQACAVLPP